MFLELIAAFAAAFAAGGLVLGINLLTGGRLPRWAMPVAAGAALLGYAVWSEYTWFDRTVATLPEGVEVGTVNRAQALWRPWTLVAPFVDRFAAIDTTSIRSNDAAPDMRIADVYFFGRWSPRRRLDVVFDCAHARMAPLPSVTFAEDGTVRQAAWETVGEDDDALDKACA